MAGPMWRSLPKVWPVVVVLALAGAAFVAGYRTDAWRHPPIDHSAVREVVILSQASQAEGPFDAVIIGDSITELALLSPRCGASVLNAGVGGYRIAQAEGLLSKVMDRASARAVLLLVGVNDAAKSQSPNPNLERDYDRLVQRAQHFAQKVFAGTVGPIGSAGFARGYDAAAIARINALIKSSAMRNGATLLDLNAIMSDANGGLRPDWTTDGVHLTVRGYQRWRTTVENAACEAADK